MAISPTEEACSVQRGFRVWFVDSLAEAKEGPDLGTSLGWSQAPTVADLEFAFVVDTAETRGFRKQTDTVQVGV